MRLTPLCAALLAAAVVSAPARAAHDPIARVDPFDQVNRCVDAVPSAPPVPVIGTQKLDLRVLVLHDDMTEAAARAVMQKVAKVYEPLNINVVAGYRAVHFPPGTLSDHNEMAKLEVGGGRPAGYDVVYTMIGAGLEEDGTAGQADCVGGVEFADRAFAAGDGLDNEISTAPTGRVFRDKAAKVAAHEIGHLMGAQHHHVTCAEGAAEEPDDWFSVCTLMSPDIGLASLVFGAVEGRHVRAAAEKFLPGKPYDGPPPIPSPERDSGTVSFDEPVLGWSGESPGYGVTLANEYHDTTAESCDEHVCDEFTLQVADSSDLTITADEFNHTGNLQVDVIKPDGTVVYDGGAPDAPTVLKFASAPVGSYTVRVVTNVPVGWGGWFKASARLAVPETR